MNFQNKGTYKLIAVIIFLILLVIFTLQNTERVRIRFFLFSISVSSALIILFSLIIGIFIGWLGIPFIQKRRRISKEAK